MEKSLTPIDIANAGERIRQKKETFDHKKKQNSQWFLSKLIMVYISIILLVSFFFISVYILLANNDFPSSVKITVGAALLVEILGLIIYVWKIVLTPNSNANLEPISRTNE